MFIAVPSLPIHILGGMKLSSGGDVTVCLMWRLEILFIGFILWFIKMTWMMMTVKRSYWKDRGGLRAATKSTVVTFATVSTELIQMKIPTKPIPSTRTITIIITSITNRSIVSWVRDPVTTIMDGPIRTYCIRRMGLIYNVESCVIW